MRATLSDRGGGLNLDPDLFRGLILRLGTAERSPPEPIFISIAEMADDFCCSTDGIWIHLDFLARSRLIEGPGVCGEGAFLFRKLTPQGRLLAGAIQDVEDWKVIKSLYIVPGGLSAKVRRAAVAPRGSGELHASRQVWLLKLILLAFWSANSLIRAVSRPARSGCASRGFGQNI